MEPENATHCFDLDRFDEAGMRNRDRMQDTFERFLPKPQKGPQLREIRVEVVVLPDVSFAAARDGQGAGTGYSPWLDRTLLPASENPAPSRESPGPQESKFFIAARLWQPRKLILVWIQGVSSVAPEPPLTTWQSHLTSAKSAPVNKNGPRLSCDRGDLFSSDNST